LEAFLNKYREKESIAKGAKKSPRKSLNKEQSPKKKKNKHSVVEISEPVLNEYTGFIKRKLGLDRKLTKNDMCLFKYNITHFPYFIDIMCNCNKT
jgi:hypothetical protein